MLCRLPHMHTYGSQRSRLFTCCIVRNDGDVQKTWVEWISLPRGGANGISICKLICGLAPAVIMRTNPARWLICKLDLCISRTRAVMSLRGCACVIVCARGLASLHDYSSFHNGTVHSLLYYGRISVFHLRDLHPAAAVWEASPVSLVTLCAACVLKTLSARVLQIKLKRRRKNLKTPKAPRKVRNILGWWVWKFVYSCSFNTQMSPLVLFWRRGAKILD